MYGSEKWSRNIINTLTEENDEKKFYRLLQIIFYLPIQTLQGYVDTEYSKEILFSRLAEAVYFSNVNLAITQRNDEIVLYPCGEKEFDQKLVNEVLSFLDTKSQKHFIDALGFYQKSNAIKSAESLRRTLEEFLRFKLNNQQGLDKNIIELQKKLKTDDRDSIVRNIIFQTFSYINQYFNENSKHKDGDIDEIENEFLIYQTGVLMRYIEKT